MPDYIVVGAGTAGCVLANQLTEDGRTTVLLIEAGGEPSSPFVRIPAGMPRLFKSKLDWAFQSEPQLGLDNRSIYIPRGKMLGGSSNMNAQIHQWCHPEDFNEWERLGAKGWGWSDVSSVFRRIERWTDDTADQARGRLGAMPVSRLKEPNALSYAFVESAHAAGVKGQEDYNGCAYSGAWLSQAAHMNGTRFSAYDAYLKPAMRRPNLSVRTNSNVKRVLFEGKRAIGVVTERDGQEETLTATRGVILSAGAFGTPQVLLLSGIGAGEQLQKLGTKVVHESPEVGRNLQEHPLSPLIYRVRRPITLKNAGSLGALLTWVLFRRGLLTSNIAEAMAFTNTQGDGGAPDFEICFAPVHWQNEGLTPPSEHACTFALVALKPRSRGSVQLKSTNWREPPAIDFGLLSDPDGHDIGVLIAGLRLTRRIGACNPLAAELAEEMTPGEGATSDADLAAFLRQETQTIYHPVGTARMGEDGGAVVDSRLRVRGVEGLWIADASVMPTIPRGHPNAVVAMIANRAADMLSAQS